MKKIILLLSLSVACFGQHFSLEDKVGQLLMVHFHGDVANGDARTLIQETKVGGIIYYRWTNGLHSPEQIRNLSEELQALAEKNSPPIRLLIATDQEGGRISRLGEGFTQWPSQRFYGDMGDRDLVERAAFEMGLEMGSVGINMNLAPVVDVDSNPHNPVIGDRSYGLSPELVALLGDAALKGLKKADIRATLKHFPGHGDTDVDSHHALPIVTKSFDELEKVELYPFAQLASSADAIMTAHLLVPAFDAENCSTLSKRTLSYLRDKLGFKGVIVSDSLVMEGVLQTCHSVDEAAILALNAGCDLLVLGGRFISSGKVGFELTVADVQRIHRSVVDAVREGRIDEKRVDEALQRVLNLKRNK